MGYLLQQRELPRHPGPDSAAAAAILSVLAKPPHPTKPLPPFDWSNLEPLLDNNAELSTSFASIIAQALPIPKDAPVTTATSLETRPLLFITGQL